MNMWKKIMVISCSLFFASCNNWLDLQPEGEASASDLFSTADGYRSVLNGVYKAMGTAPLYGMELQFGMVDCMAQAVKPYSQSDETWVKTYDAVRAYDYANVDVKAKVNQIWGTAFNAIANANVLIQNVEHASSDLFKMGDTERKMILGEAYACRALLHFDLLRLFAPAPVNDDGGNYVPYIDKFPEILGTGISVPAFLEKVEKDLLLARELVAEFDTATILGHGVNASGESRFHNELDPNISGQNTSESVDDFYQGRGYRLSYYSISALLARVYQYAGKHEQAFNEAKKVIEAKVPYVTGGETELYRDEFDGFWDDNWENRQDLKRVSSLIFAVYNENAYENDQNGLNLASYFMKRSSGMQSGRWFVIETVVQKIFETAGGKAEEGDFRCKKMIYKADGQFEISGKWYLSDDVKIRDKHLTILPVIRLTEMQYIVAEYYARSGNLAEAYKVLNDIRHQRDLWEDLQIQNDYNAFQNDLVRDAQREWVSEGQLFYLYKRLNAPIIRNVNGDASILQRNEAILPIPTEESN